MLYHTVPKSSDDPPLHALGALGLEYDGATPPWDSLRSPKSPEVGKVMVQYLAKAIILHTSGVQERVLGQVFIQDVVAHVMGFGVAGFWAFFQTSAMFRGV